MAHRTNPDRPDHRPLFRRRLRPQCRTRGAGGAPPERPPDLRRAAPQKVDALACGLRRLGLEPGDRVGIWSQNNHEWALAQFATAKGRAGAGQHQPGLSPQRTRIRPQQGGLPALILSPAFKSSDYLAMLADLAPELAHCEPGLLRAHRLPSLEIVIRLGAERAAPACSTSPTCSPAQRDETDAGRAGRAPAVRRPDQHPVHLRHHRQPEGRDPVAPQHPQQRLLRRRGDPPPRGRPRVHPGAALPLLRHGDGQPGLPHPRRHDGLSVRGLRAAGGAAGGAEERCTASYGVPTMFIAQLDHPDFAGFDLPACAPASWPAARARSR